MYQKKPKKPQIKKVQNHSPTLKTIRMVEDVLKKMDESQIRFSELKKRLPKKVNHNTLKDILRYLDQSGKVYMNIDGIAWVYNPSKKLAKAIAESYTWEELDRKYRISGILSKKI
jgi:hypothetical protein